MSAPLARHKAPLTTSHFCGRLHDGENFCGDVGIAKVTLHDRVAIANSGYGRLPEEAVWHYIGIGRGNTPTEETTRFKRQKLKSSPGGVKYDKTTRKAFMTCASEARKVNRHGIAICSRVGTVNEEEGLPRHVQKSLMTRTVANRRGKVAVRGQLGHGCQTNSLAHVSLI